MGNESSRESSQTLEEMSGIQKKLSKIKAAMSSMSNSQKPTPNSISNDHPPFPREMRSTQQIILDLDPVDEEDDYHHIEPSP